MTLDELFEIKGFFHAIENVNFTVKDDKVFAFEIKRILALVDREIALKTLDPRK